MYLPVKIKRILVTCLAIAFSFGAFSTSIFAGQVEPPSTIKEKLVVISEEEKKILQNLFTLSQEIEVMEQEEKRLAQEIETINKETKALEVAIADEEAAYKQKREGLKQVLNSYQRMGPGSYLEIIMDSNSLTTFLRRLNTLRDITRNTGELLKQLEISKGKLSAEKEKLAEKLVLIEEKQKLAKESLDNKLKLKEEKEEYLASLKGERKYYQEQLANIQKMLDELKPLLLKAVGEFANIIKEGSMPADAFKMTFSLFSIKGAIEDRAFNDIISKQPSLSEMKFSFHTDKIEVSFPERNLILSGDFVIVEGHILKFQVEEGSFYGMLLEPEYIEEMFSEGELTLDLKPLLGNSTLQSIKNNEGYIELFIKPDLF